MKKLIIALFISIFLIISNQKLEAKDTKLIKGNFYEGKLIWKSIELDLPEGKWEFMDKDEWWYHGFGFSCKSFATAEGKIFKSAIEICEMRTGGKYLTYLGPVLHRYYTKGKYDSCILRPEYLSLIHISEPTRPY